MHSTVKGRSITVGEELSALLGPDWQLDDTLRWPPDIFAVCAYILESSGAYVRVVDHWPPGRSLIEWIEGIRKTAAEWRECAGLALASMPCSVPVEVISRWQEVRSYACTSVESVYENAALCNALLELVALTDEACVGFGLPLLAEEIGQMDEVADDLMREVQVMLIRDATLSPRIPTSRLRVLPKQHTPRFGITLRSVTHHLALFTGGEVNPVWSVQADSQGERLNLLVIPWPFEVRPSQFSEAACPNLNLAASFKCFDYSTDPANSLVPERYSDGFRSWLEAVFKEAERLCGNVHGVVLPECSINSDDFKVLNEVALEHHAFVVAGVARSDEKDSGRKYNEVWMAFGEDQNRDERCIKQGKHHRWQINRNQIEMYGLGSSLDPACQWWENIAVEARDVNFVALNGLLTICCLICEDLARQDPVAKLVRAVGPNLVIALLSDGPQVTARWPARYATVLADDPGSSVLTVTSLGMTKLAAAPPGKSKTPTVALWKDATNGLKEITLEPGAAAILLNLWNFIDTETSADGRSDGGVASYPALSGYHSIHLKN